MFDDKEMREWENKATNLKTWTNAKTHFVELYRSKTKFNEEREAHRSGFESTTSIRSRSTINNSDATINSLGSNLSSNRPTNHPNSIVTRGMSPADQSTMIEYTNSIECQLVKTKEHIAILQGPQEKLWKQLGEQGNQMIQQQKEFMQMMMAGKAAPTAPAPTDVKKERTSRTATEGKYCNRRKKKVLHKYDNCWELEQNKAKYPDNWKSCLK